MPTLDGRAFALSEGLEADGYVVATYLLQGPPEEQMLGRAARIAMEQTVGRGVYSDASLNDLVEARGGKLCSLVQVPDHESKPSRTETDWQRYLARVAYPVENTGYQIPMLLTTAMGDVSLGGMIKLVELELPSSFLAAFQGPKYGLEGIRSYLGVDRPLVCAIMKPCVGLSPDQAGDLFYQYAVGGADLVKDDELMVYEGGADLEERVQACMEAERRAYEETGERTIYLVSITDRPDRLLDKARTAVGAGANGLMITPLATGISALRMIAEAEDIEVPVFGHPALLGASSWSPDFGISSHILVGKLFRVAGADINAFPVPYGRFPHLREKFLKLFHVSHTAMGNIKSCFSQTGGGLNPCNVPQVIADVGPDIQLALGGSLQRHPMGRMGGVRAVRQAIEASLDGIQLEDAAKDHSELRAACSIWSESL